MPVLILRKCSGKWLNDCCFVVLDLLVPATGIVRSDLLVPTTGNLFFKRMSKSEEFQQLIESSYLLLNSQLEQARLDLDPGHAWRIDLRDARWRLAHELDRARAGPHLARPGLAGLHVGARRDRPVEPRPHVPQHLQVWW